MDASRFVEVPKLKAIDETFLVNVLTALEVPKNSNSNPVDSLLVSLKAAVSGYNESVLRNLLG